jgi:hypothetical protein
LTGAPPVGHGDALALLTRQLTVAAPPPSTRRPALRALGVDALCAALLAKAPAARPADGLAAAHAIADVLAALTGAPGPAPLTATSRAVLVLDLGLARDDEADALAAARATIAPPAARSPARSATSCSRTSSSELAVLAAIAVSDQIVGAHGRVAVHHGEVQVDAGGGLFGPTVNHALRIARLTPPARSWCRRRRPARGPGGDGAAHPARPHPARQGSAAGAVDRRSAGRRRSGDRGPRTRRRRRRRVHLRLRRGRADRHRRRRDRVGGAVPRARSRGSCCRRPSWWARRRPRASGLVDAVGIDAGSPSADHAILAALANLE